MYYTVFLVLRGLAGAFFTFTTSGSQFTEPHSVDAQAQQQAQTPQRVQEPQPERFSNTAEIMNIPNVPPSLPICKNVNIVATTKKIPPRMRPQLLEPVLHELFIISSMIHHTNIIDDIRSVCQ